MNYITMKVCVCVCVCVKYSYIPAKDTKNKVKHKERPKNDQWHKVDPIEMATKGVICL